MVTVHKDGGAKTDQGEEWGARSMETQGQPQCSPQGRLELTLDCTHQLEWAHGLEQALEQTHELGQALGLTYGLEQALEWILGLEQAL